VAWHSSSKADSRFFFDFFTASKPSSPSSLSKYDTSEVSRAPQEPTSSLLRSGANIGKKELQEEEEEEGDEVQGGQEGRRSQEVKPRRLMGKTGVANNRKIKMDVVSLIAGKVNPASKDLLNSASSLQNTASPSSSPQVQTPSTMSFFYFSFHLPIPDSCYWCLTITHK
jgi:hypothetical protein